MIFSGGSSVRAPAGGRRRRGGMNQVFDSVYVEEKRRYEKCDCRRCSGGVHKSSKWVNVVVVVVVEIEVRVGPESAARLPINATW